MYDISFPNIGIYLKNIPTGITVFGFEIRLYGVVIFFGFWLAYFIAVKEAKRTNQNPELYQYPAGWTGNLWRIDRRCSGLLPYGTLPKGIPFDYAGYHCAWRSACTDAGTLGEFL